MEQRHLAKTKDTTSDQKYVDEDITVSTTVHHAVCSLVYCFAFCMK